MPLLNCPLCGAPLPLVLDATTGRCPSCKFDFGRILDVFALPTSAVPPPAAANDRDSLDTVEMVMRLEEHFDINLSEEEAASAHTIEDVLRLLEKYRRRPPGEQSDE